jgi:hypothetical protein
MPLPSALVLVLIMLRWRPTRPWKGRDGVSFSRDLKHPGRHCSVGVEQWNVLAHGSEMPFHVPPLTGELGFFSFGRGLVSAGCRMHDVQDPATGLTTYGHHWLKPTDSHSPTPSRT